MYFVIKFIATDPMTRQPLSDNLICKSEPIKVISKPEQVRKRRKTTDKRRSINDILLESLSRIQKAQEEQQQQLDKLQDTMNSLQQTAIPADVANWLINEAQGGSLDEKKGWNLPRLWLMLSSVGKEEQMDFEASFQDLMQSYEDLPAAERSNHVRNVVARNSQFNTNEQLLEMVDLFAAEGLQREIGEQVDQMGTENNICECENCPHRQELERVEGFYRDVFSLSWLLGLEDELRKVVLARVESFHSVCADAEFMCLEGSLLSCPSCQKCAQPQPPCSLVCNVWKLGYVKLYVQRTTQWESMPIGRSGYFSFCVLWAARQTLQDTILVFSTALLWPSPSRKGWTLSGLGGWSCPFWKHHCLLL